MNEEARKEQLEKIRKKAKQIGLEIQGTSGRFYIPGIAYSIMDLSATDPEKIAMAIFREGEEAGRRDIQNKMQALLGIE